MRAVVDGATPLLQFSIDRRLARWDLDRPEERARALKEAAEVLAPVKDSLLADDYATYIADKLFADVGTVKRAIASVGCARHCGAAAGPDADVPARPRVRPADTPQLRLERDLLDLLVRTPRLRPRARFLLSENLLTDPLHQAIASKVAESGPEQSADALVGAMQSAVPGAAEALSGATLGDVADADVEAAERDMTRKLKEFDLERRIAGGKARLRQPASFKEPARV